MLFDFVCMKRPKWAVLHALRIGHLILKPAAVRTFQIAHCKHRPKGRILLPSKLLSSLLSLSIVHPIAKANTFLTLSLLSTLASLPAIRKQSVYPRESQSMGTPHNSPSLNDADFEHRIGDSIHYTGSINAPEIDPSVLAPQPYPLVEGLQV